VIERQIGVSPLQVKWVPVTTQTRFSAVASGQADMECGASTMTLERMGQVSFSSLIYLDGTGLLVRASTPGTTLLDMSGKKIGVIAGTSNERALTEGLKSRVVTATLVPVKSREDGMAQLDAGAIDVFASDRVLLMGLVSQAKDQKAYALLVDALSYEPYAIALPRGDWAMKQAVDAALSQIYGSPAIGEIYGRWFGAIGKPGPGARDDVRPRPHPRVTAGAAGAQPAFSATARRGIASDAYGRVEPAQHDHRVENRVDPGVVAARADHEDRVGRGARKGVAVALSQRSRP
jgi:ABC-type amino acid transport substrate-binding protein